MTETSAPAKTHTEIEGLAQTNLYNLTREAAEWANTKSLAEQELARVKEEVASILSAFKVENVKVEGTQRRWIVAKGAAPRRTLSVDKLLKRGVAMSTIDACMDLGEPGKPSLRLMTVEEEEQAA